MAAGGTRSWPLRRVIYNLCLFVLWLVLAFHFNMHSQRCYFINFIYVSPSLDEIVTLSGYI